MAESHVVSGLVAKRGELARRVQLCRRELRQLAGEAKLMAQMLYGCGLRVARKSSRSANASGKPSAANGTCRR